MLESITLPNTLKTIGDHAFWDCYSLETITLPNSLKSIGDSAFTYCDSLNEANFGGTVEQWDAVMIGDNNALLKKLTIHCTDGDISKCGDGLTWKFENGVLTISGEGDMYNYSFPWDALKDEITSVVIENGVTSIGNYAFGG